MKFITSKSKTQIFDTTVFIDYLRGKEEVKPFIQQALSGEEHFVVSIITVVELWAGVKDQEDEKKHKVLLAPFRKMPINLPIAYRAGRLAYSFYQKKDKSISLADFVIAATAEYLGADIVTRNRSCFHKIPLENVNLFVYELKGSLCD